MEFMLFKLLDYESLVYMYFIVGGSIFLWKMCKVDNIIMMISFC